MGFLSNIWTWITGSVLFLLTVVKSLVFLKMRLQSKYGMVLTELVLDTAKIFSFEEEITTSKLPKVFRALVLLPNMPLFIDFQERVLQAGWNGTETLYNVTLFRWHKTKLLNSIKDRLQTEQYQCPVKLMTPYDTEKIGLLSSHIEKPWVETSIMSQIDETLKDLIRGKIQRTGFILYGPPGNGKSHLIRYMSYIHKLPIYIFTLKPEHTNFDIIKMFSHITEPCIILMEDFDSYFNLRTPVMTNVNYSFDVILNIIDGTMNSTPGLVFFLTTNNIDSIDSSLSRRPSRFKKSFLISNPSTEMIKKIVDSTSGKTEKIKNLYGLSLDQILNRGTT